MLFGPRLPDAVYFFASMGCLSVSPCSTLSSVVCGTVSKVVRFFMRLQSNRADSPLHGAISYSLYRDAPYLVLLTIR